MRFALLAIASLASAVLPLEIAVASTRGARASLVAAGKRASGERRAYEGWPTGSLRFVTASRKEVRRALAASPTPGSAPYVNGQDVATARIAQVVGQALGRAPAEVRASGRRHERALRKLHRTAIHRIEQARASGRDLRAAFPDAPFGATYDSLLLAERRALADLDRGARWETELADAPRAKRPEKAERAPLPVGVGRRDRAWLAD